MKKANFIILLLILSVEAFSQFRQIPSVEIEKANSFIGTERMENEWDYYNDFQDSTSLYNMNIDNLDSLSDNPNVYTMTGLNFYPDSWILLHFVDNSNNWAASNSYLVSPGQADRWLITPEIVVSSGSKLTWKSLSVRYPGTLGTFESYEVYISNSNGNGWEDFVLPPVYEVAQEDSLWASHELDLSSYWGDSIYIAFRHTSNNQGILALDDIKVAPEPTPPSAVFGDFEGYDDFTFDLNPWKNLDLDSSITYTIQGISFPYSGEAMPYIVFNPYNTSPILDNGDPHGGEKYGACFASVPVSLGGNGPNNDWMISPQITIAQNGWLKFWARSFTLLYGKERFKVGVSATTDNPEDFTFISPGNYVEADTAWTEFSYDLSAYGNQLVYIAINCVSDNAFVFLIDDISIDTVGVQGINLVENESMEFYPNPSSGVVAFKNLDNSEISVYNILGIKVAGYNIFENTPEIDLSFLTPGTYFIKGEGEKGFMQKIILVK